MTKKVQDSHYRNLLFWGISQKAAHVSETLNNSTKYFMSAANSFIVSLSVAKKLNKETSAGENYLAWRNCLKENQTVNLSTQNCQFL